MATEPPIGTKIRKRRQVLRLTQQQLAAQLDVSKSTVANWESGKHFPRRYLGAVENVLGITLTDEGAPETPPIPPEVLRSLDRLTDDQRAYVAELLSSPRENRE